MFGIHMSFTKLVKPYYGVESINIAATYTLPLESLDCVDYRLQPDGSSKMILIIYQISEHMQHYSRCRKMLKK